MYLAKGANTPIFFAELTVSLRNFPTPGSVDLCAVAVDANGKVRNDQDVVFYNQNISGDGCIALVGVGEIAGIRVRLGDLAQSVRTVIVAGSLNDDSTEFGDFLGSEVVVDGGEKRIVHKLSGLSSERCALLVEFYRRGEVWKVRALSQGYESGLGGLFTDYGVRVDDPGTSTRDSAAPRRGPRSSVGEGPGHLPGKFNELLRAVRLTRIAEEGDAGSSGSLRERVRPLMRADDQHK